jgi:hypothetical protein
VTTDSGMAGEAYTPRPGLGVVLDGAVLRLTLDRPDKRNALDDVMVAGLIEAIDAPARAATSAGAPTSWPGTRAGPTLLGPGSGRSSAGCRRWPTVWCRS